MTSPMWAPINEYIKSLQNGQLPALHHYTDLKGAIGILDSGRMWFSDRTILNDTTELSLGVNIATELLGATHFASVTKDFAATARKVFETFCFFSASYSLKMNDPYQWHHYGDGGRGVMLSFNGTSFACPKKFVDSNIFGNPSAFTLPMSYDESDLKDLLRKVICAWDRANPSELLDLIFIASSMFKGTKWRNEREYRFLIHARRDVISRHGIFKYRVSNGKLGPYLEMPIQNWDDTANFPVCAITVGPISPEGTEDQLRYFMQWKYPKVKVQDIKRADLDEEPIEQGSRPATGIPVGGA